MIGPTVSEERRGAVAIVTIDVPARRNALALPVRAALAAAFARAHDDPAVRAIVLTCAGEHFCAGGDITEFGRLPIATGMARFDITHDLVRRVALGPKPVVAAVEGHAAGAGFALALLCDTVVAAEGAQFTASFGRLGLIPDFGLLHTLPARIGTGRAREMCLYGEPLGAAQACAWGVADALTPTGGALDAALARAEKLARAAPLPLTFVRRWLADGLEAALARERDTQTLMFQSEDFAEGIAAFREKRPPVFRGA